MMETGDILQLITMVTGFVIFMLRLESKITQIEGRLEAIQLKLVGKIYGVVNQKEARVEKLEKEIIELRTRLKHLEESIHE